MNCLFVGYNLGHIEVVSVVDYKTLPSAELVLHCLRTGEEPAWIEFVHRFQPLIASVALRVARQWGQAFPWVIDDLVQDTYLKLCADRLRFLETFKSSHEDAVYGYMKVFTANLAHDHFKAWTAQKRGGRAETTSMEDSPASEGAVRVEPADALMIRKLLVGKVAACLEFITTGQNADRDRRIFWFYYRAGLSASAIATLPGIGLTTKGVESIILRLTRAVRQQLSAPKQEGASGGKTLEGITPAESL